MMSLPSTICVHGKISCSIICTHSTEVNTLRELYIDITVTLYIDLLTWVQLLLNFYTSHNDTPFSWQWRSPFARRWNTWQLGCINGLGPLQRALRPLQRRRWWKVWGRWPRAYRAGSLVVANCPPPTKSNSCTRKKTGNCVRWCFLKSMTYNLYSPVCDQISKQILHKEVRL